MNCSWCVAVGRVHTGCFFVCVCVWGGGWKDSMGVGCGVNPRCGCMPHPGKIRKLGASTVCLE